MNTPTSDADKPTTPKPKPASASETAESDKTEAVKANNGEIGGPKGPEPTRFGDWEQKGRCSDF